MRTLIILTYTPPATLSSHAMAHTSPKSTARSRMQKTQPAIPPFWHRLNAFFLFPFQSAPLLYGAVLALCALAVMASPLIGFFVVVGILLATARYAFKVTAMASMGVLKSSEYDRTQSDPAWTNLPWKFLGALMVHALVIGLFTRVAEPLGTLGTLTSSFLVPATQMVLIQTCSFRSAINPLRLGAAVAAVGWPYLLLCLFTVLLSMGMPMAWAMLLPLAPKGLIAPLMAYVVIYFSWVSDSMVGYAMFQNHEKLDIDLVQDPQAALSGTGSGGRRPESPEAVLARERDAEIADLIQEQHIDAAYDLAYDWQRANPESVADQRRYHRVLLLTDKKDRVLWFTEKYLQSLIKSKNGQEALKVFAASRAKFPDLALESAEITLAVAQLAWKAGDTRNAMALLKGFDKRFPKHALLPEAYELIARILEQGLGRTEQALAIYRAMKLQYANHPSTQEVAWFMRQHTGESTASVAPSAQPMGS
jgi:hypothetical protein